MLCLLGASIFIFHLGRGILDAGGVEADPNADFLYRAILVCGVVWWLRAESRPSPAKHLYCEGLLAMVAWPIIVPYHLLKTRGLRGLLPLFALIGAFILARILGVVIYIAFVGLPVGLNQP